MKKLELLMLLASTCLCLSAATLTIDELSFDTIGRGECVVSATAPFCLHGSIDIPSHVVFCGRSYAVTAIRGDAFRGSQICRVKIPATVREIGPMAFSGTKIKTIDIPSSIRVIQHDAFRNCQELRTVTLHDGLLHIETEAFSRCYNLKQLTIPSSVRYIGDFCFGECVRLRDVHFEGEPDTCGVGVFIDCNMKSPIQTSQYLLYCPISCRGTFVIPNGITTISGSVLEFCDQLDTIMFPESIEDIYIETYVSQQRWVFLSKNPPILHISPSLYQHTNEHISIVVPQGCRDTYSESPSWQGFTNITEK